MEWTFHFSENALCDQITLVVQMVQARLHSASVYENNGNNSFRQHFCARSLSFHYFLAKPGCQTGHVYSSTERTIVQ